VPSFEFPRVYGEGRLKAIPDGWRVLKKILWEDINRGKQIIRTRTAKIRRLARDLQNLSKVEKNSIPDLDHEEAS
jgi:hypothetical protein